MRKIFVVATSFLLASCAGGAFGNLLPLPKFLKGSIDEGLYSSPKGIFSVLTPFLQGSTPFIYMEVKENSKDWWDSVTFYSSTHARNRYRVEAGLASEEDVIRDAEHYLSESGKFFKEKYTAAGATNYRVVSSGGLVIGAGDARFSVHTYTAPPRFSVLNLASTTPYQAWILIVTCVTDSGALYMSFDFSGDCEPCSKGDIGSLREEHKDIDRMLDSIKINWEAS